MHADKQQTEKQCNCTISDHWSNFSNAFSQRRPGRWFPFDQRAPDPRCDGRNVASVQQEEIKDVFDWFRGKALTRKGKSMFMVSSNKKNTCCWQKKPKGMSNSRWCTRNWVRERAMFAPLSFLSTWTARGKRELQHDWKHLNESGVSSPAKHRLQELPTRDAVVRRFYISILSLHEVTIACFACVWCQDIERVRETYKHASTTIPSVL